MTGGTSSRPWLPYALAAAAAAMAAFVYLNALHNPFVYDDNRVILENYSIRDLSNIRALLLNDAFRPLVNISYAFDYAHSGLQPFGYHVTSVLLHMANVILLFVLVRTLAGDARAMQSLAREAPQAAPAPQRAGKKAKGGARVEPAAPDPDVRATANAAAFGAAAIWAVHPMMTQAVGYISGRSEVLCALFFLSALLLLHAWVFGRGRGWLVAGLGCWVLSLASKEVAVMLPVVLLAFDGLLLSPVDAPARGRLRRLAVPMLVLVAVGGAARLFVFAGMENASRANFAWNNLLVGLDVVRRYIRLMFLLEPQAIFHTAVVPSSLLRPLVVLNVLWFLVLGAAAWMAHRRSPLIAFGAFWLLVMLLPPVAMLVIDVGEPVAEQRAYLAGAGFAIATGATFGRLRGWPARHRLSARLLVSSLFAVLLLVMAAQTAARNAVWSDPVRLWREAASTAPDIWLPHRGLGDALRDKGDYAGAAAAYVEAARLRPQEAGTHLALGITLLMAGRLAQADVALAEAARLSPGMPEAETARGMIARALGRRDEARDRFLAVAGAHPNAVIARQYLADMYENDYADYAGALRMCREVQALAPQAQGVGDCIARNQQRLAAPPVPAEKR